MNALLVYPRYQDTYWSFRHALRFERRKAAFPPLGLLTLSAMMPATWTRRLIDLNIERITPADYEWADVVFVSAMLVQKASLISIIAACRARGKRLVVGGPVTTTCEPEIFQGCTCFFGEAESTFPRFVDDLAAGTLADVYEADERPHMSTSPVPDFALARAEAYGAMAVQLSRGCPYQCEFCDIIEIYGRVPRYKSPDQMLAELNALYATGYRGTLFIVDDNFIGNRGAVGALLPLLEQWQRARGFPFDLMTEASINLADEAEMMSSMCKAGFRRVFVGIETPVEASLRETRKTQNAARDMSQRIRAIQAAGMEVMGGFIVGFDNDPLDVFELQRAFIRDSAIPIAMVGLLNVLPSTQLWRRLSAEGRILTESVGDNTDGRLNFVPKMDAAVLMGGYRDLMHRLYHPKEYYPRALESIRRTAGSSVPPQPSSIPAAVASLTRILIRLGLISTGRRAFWTYFRRVLTNHRVQMADAMRLAVMGYHVRRLTAPNRRQAS